MKSMNPVMFVALGAAVMGGCTTTGTISGMPQDKVTAIQSGGNTWLLSVRKNTVAVRPVTPTYRTRAKDFLFPAFLLEVRNGGAEGIALSSDDVTASISGKPVPCLTLGECQEVIRRSDREIATIKAAIGNMWSPLDMSERDQSLGIGSGSGLQAMQSFGEQGLTTIQQLYLRREVLLAEAKAMIGPGPSSIAPGQSIRRVILFNPSELSSGHRVIIQVKAGGETHEFSFDLGS